MGSEKHNLFRPMRNDNGASQHWSLKWKSRSLEYIIKMCVASQLSKNHGRLGLKRGFSVISICAYLFWDSSIHYWHPTFLFFSFSSTAPLLLYANRKDIRIFNANSRNESIIIDDLNDAIAVDFLFAEGIIFWADVNLKKIKRIRVSTGEVKDVISVGLKKPEGLAVDWIAGKLYWTDCRDAKWDQRNRIEVANLDGSNRKVLFWKDLGLPRAIAVDPLLG